VLDTRPVPGAVRRRRECTTCGERFTTFERVGPDELESAVVAYVRSLDPTTKEIAA
jgi:transcriptional regulator NrdR family protein